MSSDQQMSLIQKMASIFWSPTKTFNSIKKEINWTDIVIPLLLVVIVSWITIPYITPISTKMAKERIENKEDISESQKEQMLESVGKTTQGALQYITALIGVGLSAVILALIMWFAGNMVLGGEVEFMKLFALAAYISLIGIISTIVKTPLMVSQGTTEVYTGAAILFEKSDTFFFRLMKNIDIFTIWKTVLFGLGLGALYESKKNKALYLVFGLWFVWIIAASLMGALNPLA